MRGEGFEGARGIVTVSPHGVERTDCAAGEVANDY